MGGWTKVSKSVDIASIAATTAVATAVTVAGVITDDEVVAIPPEGLEDDLIPIGANVTAADTISLTVYNPTAGAINPAAATWTFIVFRGDGDHPILLG